jgi:plastocyanin domain-containing protein
MQQLNLTIDGMTYSHCTQRVEFLPLERGEFEFACQTGMLRGKLIVE